MCVRFHVIMRLCRVYRELLKESTIKLSKHLLTLTSFTDILLFLNIIIDWQNFVLDTRTNRPGEGGTWTLQGRIFHRPFQPGPTISIDSFNSFRYLGDLRYIHLKICILLFKNMCMSKRMCENTCNIV